MVKKRLKLNIYIKREERKKGDEMLWWWKKGEERKRGGGKPRVPYMFPNIKWFNKKYLKLKNSGQKIIS